ncbi:MAG: hypothetical protein ACYTFY_13350 [Planctomycetota bacterium]|jgi:hypothetical protein
MADLNSDTQNQTAPQQPPQQNPQKNPQSIPEQDDYVSTNDSILSVLSTLFLDIFRVFGVCVLGISDKSRDFTNAIEMAERYFRWGQDQDELQDFLTALHYCKDAHDEDAKKADMLIRKYKVVFTSYVSVIRKTVDEFRDKFFQTIEEYNIKINNLNSSYKNFERTMKEVVNLYKTDNPLAALEQEYQADKMLKLVNKAQHERSVYLNNDQFSVIFEGVCELIENFHLELNRQLVLFQNLQGIQIHKKESMTAGLQEEIEQIKEGLKEFSPYQLRKRYSILEKDKENIFEKLDPVFDIDENEQHTSIVQKQIKEEEEQRKKELKEKMNERGIQG